MALSSAKTMPTNALQFEVVARCSRTRARAGVLRLKRTSDFCKSAKSTNNSVDQPDDGYLTDPVMTPIFMPVGTNGTMKGLLPEQIEATGCRLMLSNTYHLGLRPGNPFNC